MTLQTYDAIIVGTGQAGKPLARDLSDAFDRVAIVERGRVGGTCIIDGCTPTKTMVASARIAHLAARSSDFGIETGQVFVRMSDVRDRKRSIVEKFSSSARAGLVEKDGIELVEGTARFLSSDTLAVDGSEPGHAPRRLRSERIFLDVGARPRVPDLPGLEGVPFLDSTSIMEVEEVPAELVILGGGPVGLEFGQLFARLGSRVTIVEREGRLLPREDEALGSELASVLQEDGVTIFTDAIATRVSNGVGEAIHLSLQTPEGPIEAAASHLLVAVGRTSNADTLDLDRAGLSTDDSGHLPVDDRCRTVVDGIWALGDMTGAPPFTHVAYDDYRIALADVLPDRPSRSREGRMVPWTIFTDPEVARVGLDRRGADEKGVAYRTARMEMTSSARALETDETRGYVECLVDPEDGRILGATVLAVHGGELMSLLQTAMMGGLSWQTLRDAIYAHPTFAESIQTLFARLD